MAAKREDQPVDIWLKRGDNLLNNMQSQRGLSRKIRTQLNRLKSAAKAGDEEKIKDALNTLNSTKYDLADEWGNWLRRNRQHIVDKKRSRFYVSDEAYERVLRFTEQSSYEGSPTKSIEQLLLALDSLGLTNISSIYDIQELLKPYSDTYNGSISSSSEVGHLASVINSLISTLADNDVNDFTDLRNLEKARKQAKNLKRQAEEQLNSAKPEVDSLKQALTAKSEKIAELEDQLKAKDVEVAKLMQRLKHLDTPRKRALQRKTR